MPEGAPLTRRAAIEWVSTQRAFADYHAMHYSSPHQILEQAGIDINMKDLIIISRGPLCNGHPEINLV
jgi:hypothetical protein